MSFSQFIKLFLYLRLPIAEWPLVTFPELRDKNKTKHEAFESRKSSQIIQEYSLLMYIWPPQESWS